MIETREQWLNELNDRLDPLFQSAGFRSRPKMRLSCGFPSSRARPNRKGNYTLGQCHYCEQSADKTNEIFVHPSIDDPVRVADVLVHERLHTHLPVGTGHKKPFARAAKALGLEGKPTATVAGQQLETKLKTITDELGPYPHAALDASGGPKQTTRLIKVYCEECGCIIRITSKWIEMVGLPVCGCGNPMQMDFGDDQVKLTPMESLIEYDHEDKRFTLRFVKDRRGQRWYVIDHGEDGGRMTQCSEKQEALDLITAIQEGLYTYDPLFERPVDYDEESQHLDPDEIEDLDEPDDDLDGEDEYPEIQEHEPIEVAA